MFSALYYPHVNISKELFKNALFLWDNIEYIAPTKDFRPYYEDHELSEAVEAFSVKHVPTKKEKELANSVILDLLTKPLPDYFYVRELPEMFLYSFYPEKLFPETWRDLKKLGLATDLGTEIKTSASLGLTIMSILADCCAGTQKRLITDEFASYSALNNYMSTIGGVDFGNYNIESERLITISLKTLDFKNVKLSRILELRQNEKNNVLLTELRHGYLKRIDDYVDKLSKATNSSDITEIERVYEQDIQNDFELLKDELKDEAKKVIVSAEMATAIVAIAGSIVQPVVGLSVAGGALYRRKLEYRAARNKILKNHPTSWLYSINKFQVL